MPYPQGNPWDGGYPSTMHSYQQPYQQPMQPPVRVQAITPKARWTREDVRPLAESRGMADKLDELWPVMCMLASDLGDVARAHGVDTPDFWADLARAWLRDEDAQPYKAYTYMHTIAGL